MLPRILSTIAITALLLLSGCSENAEASASQSSANHPAQVHINLDDPQTLFTWYDEDGPHITESRETIPEAHRARVRVDSLALSPEDRDPGVVYVVDLRVAEPEIEAVDREAFDALLAPEEPAATELPTEPQELAQNSSDVTIFGASWCGACRQAKAYLRSRDIDFVERDVEEEPGARAEMQRRAREAGVRVSGIPVIDFRGTILSGFNRSAIDRLAGL